MRVKIQEVPLEVRRRVAQKLESVRGTEMAPGSENAHLGAEACPIYRHDLREVAYWEFEITGLKQVKSRGHEGKNNGAGFMLASAGAHDTPIPHWSFTNEAPSRALESLAKQGKVARIIKLDTLAYAAEDEKGNYIVHIGQMPMKLEGMDAAAMGKSLGISTVTAMPKAHTKNDDAKAELVIKSEGAAVPKVKLTAWASYAELKSGFAKHYEPHLKAQASRAAAAWNVESLISKFGEGIHEGQKHTVALLAPGKATVTGDGAKMVNLAELKRQSPAVALEARASAEKKEANFQVEIAYDDGTKETLHYFVVPKGTPSNMRTVLPHFVIKPQ